MTIFGNLWAGLIFWEMIFGPPESVGIEDGYPLVFLWWCPPVGVSVLIGVAGGIAARRAGLATKSWANSLIIFALLPAIVVVVLTIIPWLTDAF